MAYNIGHLVTAEGDSVAPDGNYLVALNKLSKGRHISVGPSIPESAQLIDISGDKMKLLYDAFTEPEPHYAVMIKADKLDPVEVYKRTTTTGRRTPTPSGPPKRPGSSARATTSRSGCWRCARTSPPT